MGFNKETEDETEVTKGVARDVAQLLIHWNRRIPTLMRVLF